MLKIVHVLQEISLWTDRKTDTQTYSSHYFATAPVGKVTTVNYWGFPRQYIMGCVLHVVAFWQSGTTAGHISKVTLR